MSSILGHGRPNRARTVNDTPSAADLILYPPFITYEVKFFSLFRVSQCI